MRVIGGDIVALQVAVLAHNTNLLFRAAGRAAK